MRVRLFLVLAVLFASTLSASADECPDYDLFQFDFGERLGAGLAGVPKEFCKPCGGRGELACGEDNARSCDQGLAVYPRIGGLSDRIQGQMEANDVPDFVVDNVSEIVNRIRFCLPVTNLGNRPAPQAPPPVSDDRGARTFVLIGGMGGNIPLNAFEGEGNSVRQLVEGKYHRVYAVNYNAGHARENGRFLPVQIFRVEAGGAMTLVYSGSRPMDGRNLDFLRVAADIARGLTQIDVDPDLTIMAYSMGGYIAKSIVYRQFEYLLRNDIRIRGMIFLAHPHFAEAGLSGSDIASLFCSELAQGTFLDGFEQAEQVDLPSEVDPTNPIEMILRSRNAIMTSAAPAFDQLTTVSSAGSLNIAGSQADWEVIIGQTCTLGRWLHAWNAGMFAADLANRPLRTIDGRDYPFIRWTYLAGANAVTEPGGSNFYTQNTPSDGRTPVYSAMGQDGANKFAGPRMLRADFRRSYSDCGHDYDCLLLNIMDQIDVGPPRAGIPYRVQAEDSLWSVATATLAAKGVVEDDAQLDAYWRLLADANGISLAGRAQLDPDQVIAMPVPGQIVQEGDTLYDLSDGDWVSLYRAGRASFGGDPDVIYPGRYIPQ